MQRIEGMEKADDGLYNIKVMNKASGNRFEAVYDKNGILVTDSINMGSYNYAPFDSTHWLRHDIYDVNPYEKFGNILSSPQKGETVINSAVDASVPHAIKGVHNKHRNKVKKRLRD